MTEAAGAYADEDDDRLITDINVTPLVDIVLVLLIVFMITMPIIVKMDSMQENELNISLPEAAEVPPLDAKPSTQLVVNVDASGQYIVNRVPRSQVELSQLLEATNSRTPKPTTVLIRADKHCAWQYVSTLITLLQNAKIQNYMVSTLEQ